MPGLLPSPGSDSRLFGDMCNQSLGVILLFLYVVEEHITVHIWPVALDVVVGGDTHGRDNLNGIFA
jgi:S-adenosylmethionine/arginine decarboxylase-like enzyme